MLKVENNLTQILRSEFATEELMQLSEKEAISYLRLYHVKHYGVSTILFLGFSNEELASLSSIARGSDLEIKSMVSKDLTFLCHSENFDKKRVEKAKGHGVKILNRYDFLGVFGEQVCPLLNNKTLYDFNVVEEFRIIQPLSNFNRDVELNSFSDDSEKIYRVNLYGMVCDCLNFQKEQRTQFSKGDIRRMCKHLMSEYRNKVGLTGLSNFSTCAIESGYPLNRDFKQIHLGSIRYAVIVSFGSKKDWWDVFFPNDYGEYKRYGYSSVENRFSYGDKPVGYVMELKHMLKEIQKGLNKPEELEASLRSLWLKLFLLLLIIVILIYLVL